MVDRTAIARRRFMASAVGTAAGVGCTRSGRAAIDAALDEETGRVTGVVRLADRSVRGRSGPEGGRDVVTNLKRRAAATQRRLVDYAETTPGIEVRRRFWVANAVLVTVDTRIASLTDLAGVPGVERIHRTGKRRQRGAVGAPAAQTDGADADRTVSYGLELMNVPEVWDRFGTRGEGASVAVIDTGVDPSHPDLDLTGWAEFDEDGERVGSDPHDPHGHGTGMSSLATGGDASGTRIGVAPAADLYVARQHPDALVPSSLAALEWAIEKGADVVSMSFEFGALVHEAIEAVDNALAAGTIPVAAALGPDQFLTPASLHSVLTTGSVDDSLRPYQNGNGGVIRRDRYWRDVPVPQDWPDRYVVPNVTAAGVDTLTAVPDNDQFDGGHRRSSGTSNSAPHVAGVVALLRSLDAELSPETVRRRIVETASQPGNPAERPDPNGDYGHGVVDAAAAAGAVRGRPNQVSGTVTDADGDPVSGARVRAVTGDATETDDDGRYALSVSDGDARVTASAVGYEPFSRTAAAGEGRDLSLETEVRPDCRLAARPPTHVAPGSTATIEFDVEHAEFATLFLGESPYLVDESALEARIDGTAVPIGEPTNVAGASELRVEIDVTEGAHGLLPVQLSLANGERNANLDVDPIHVHERPMRVTEDQDLRAVLRAVAPETTIRLDGDRWEVPIEPTDAPLPDSRYTVPVFERTRNDRAGLLVDKPVTVTAASGRDPTLVATGGEGGDRTFGIQVAHHFATLRDLTVTAEGADGAVSVLDGDGVHLENLDLSGADAGVLAQFTKSLVVRDCSISAADVGVSIRDYSVNALVADTSIRNAARGVFLSGRTGERLFEVDATVTGTAYEGVDRELDTEGTARINAANGTTLLGGEPSSDSSLALVLYAATATAVGALLFPNLRRRWR